VTALIPNSKQAFHPAVWSSNTLDASLNHKNCKLKETIKILMKICHKTTFIPI
jgi:hypothetical protein